MFKPIQIHYPDSLEHAGRLPADPMQGCRYPLPGAEGIYHGSDRARVWEQWYDSRDTFLQLIQVDVSQEELLLPFSTTHHDLYAFHQLSGPRLKIVRQQVRANGHRMRLDEGEYRLSYLPTAHYHAYFLPGSYLIFYFVIKDRLLFREQSPELRAPGSEPVQALQQRLDSMRLSPARDIPFHAQQRITAYLRRPGLTYLERLENMQQTLIYLLRQYLQDLRLWQIGEQQDQLIVQRIITFIQQGIADGTDIRAELLSEQSGLSLAELNRLFILHQGCSLQRYLIQQKLDHACRMLDQALPVELVAGYLNWHPAHFRRVFRKQYGCSPSQYRKRN